MMDLLKRFVVWLFGRLTGFELSVVVICGECQRRLTSSHGSFPRKTW